MRFNHNGLMKRGSELSFEQKRYVLSVYVHRYTKDHIPAWSRRTWKDGKAYPVQYGSDQEWLERTYFNVTKDGHLVRNRDCYSTTPTWPDNPELRR